MLIINEYILKFGLDVRNTTLPNRFIKRGIPLFISDLISLQWELNFSQYTPHIYHNWVMCVDSMVSASNKWTISIILNFYIGSNFSPRNWLVSCGLQLLIKSFKTNFSSALFLTWYLELHENQPLFLHICQTRWLKFFRDILFHLWFPET